MTPSQSLNNPHYAAGEHLQAKHRQHLHLCAADIEALPLAAGSFDGTLANHVLYHLNDIFQGVRPLALASRPL